MDKDHLVNLLVTFVFLVLYFMFTSKKKTSKPQPLSEPSEMRRREKTAPVPFSKGTGKRAKTQASESQFISSYKQEEKVSSSSNQSDEGVSSYEVERKKKKTVLLNGWNQKRSLRQVFLLSEVLKGPYER